MLGDYAGRALVATAVSLTFAGDLLIRFVSSPSFVPACNLAGAVLAASYAAWSAKRARDGSKPPSPAAVAAAGEALVQILAVVSRQFAKADGSADAGALKIFAPADDPDPAA